MYRDKKQECIPSERVCTPVFWMSRDTLSLKRKRKSFGYDKLFSAIVWGNFILGLTMNVKMI